MTDYLEELLYEQEPEENRQGLEWKRPTSLRSTEKPQLVGSMSGAEDSLSQRVSTELVAEKSARMRIDFARKAGPDFSLGQTETVPAAPYEAGKQTFPPPGSLAAQIVRLRRAIRQADIQISRPASGANTAAEHSGTSWSGGTPLTQTANYAALVDAAFSRDARRYDGPLGLL